MEKTVENIINELSTSINDQVYTALIDNGFDPGVAYERAFSQGFDLSVDVEAVGGVDDSAELESWVPSL